MLYEFRKETLKFNMKSSIFTNTPCKSTCLYNAPSMHTVDWRIQDFRTGPPEVAHERSYEQMNISYADPPFIRFRDFLSKFREKLEGNN